MNSYLDTLLSGDIPREWSFEPAEYDARIKALRGRMAARGIDVMLIHGAVDLCYLTGYQTLWPDAYACLVVPQGGEPFMQVGEVEASCAVLHGGITDLVLFDWVGAAAIPGQLADLLKARGFGNKAIGVQSGRIEMGKSGPVDAHLLDHLRTALDGARFMDATLLMFELRFRKSPAEMVYMRRAAKITDSGMRAAVAAVEPGKTENDIAALAAMVMIAAGSEFFSIDPIVNAGHRTGYFHTTFKRHPIAEGDPVQLEFGGCFHGYTAPQMRTVLTGPPTDFQRRIIDTQLAALETLYGAVRPGRSVRDVAKETQKTVGAMDDEIFRSGHFGYSVGLGFPPTWTDGPGYLSEDNDFELEVGMTFHTPFSWRVPKEFVIGTSETIAVTETGCDTLTSDERSVEIK
ncbi:MAG: Xaa-Pro peptidase family protein [Alphaproteobacteria bacterium]